MTTRFHHKLVRDKIPNIIRANGATPDFRVIVDDDEYLAALTTKQVEEAEEVRDNPSLGELADAQEVLNSIARFLGYTPEDVEEARAQKYNERGGFEGRIFLISTEE